MHYDGHVMLVCYLKYTAQLFDVCGIVQLNIRVAEVKLESVTEVRIARAPYDFV